MRVMDGSSLVHSAERRELTVKIKKSTKDLSLEEHDFLTRSMIKKIDPSNKKNLFFLTINEFRQQRMITKTILEYLTIHSCN